MDRYFGVEIFPKILSPFKEPIPNHLNIKLVVERRSKGDCKIVSKLVNEVRSLTNNNLKHDER